MAILSVFWFCGGGSKLGDPGHGFINKLIILTINKNSLIVIDNVLWHGEVADKSKNDKFTNIIRKFNTHIKKDKRIVKNITPIGDGLTICIKK